MMRTNKLSFDITKDVVSSLTTHLSQILNDCNVEEAVEELGKAFVDCNIKTFEKYLTLGMDPNLRLSKDHVPLTCLMSHAVSSKWTEIAKLLMEKGASPNIKDYKGVPAMFGLVSSGEVELVSLALSHGADLNLRGSDGENAVLVAVHYKQTECLKVLLQRGVDPNVVDKDGSSAVMWAAGRSNGIGMQRSLTCLRMLLEYGADVNIANHKGYTPLMAASLIREENAVKMLLSAGANLEARDKKGDTALIKAIDGNSEELVKLFIKAGADINSRNSDGVTPLMIASSFSILESLILVGADVNAFDNLGRTVLHYQTDADQWEHVRVLLEFGAKHSTKNEVGETPLQIAIRRKNVRTIFILIDAGSCMEDTNIRNVGLIHDTLLPWDYFNTVNIFPKLNTPALWRELLFYTSQYRSLTHRLLEILLKFPGNVNLRGEGGVTPLMISAGCSDMKAVKLLLSSGADACLGDESERTALSYAAKSGNEDILTLLMREGCNPNIEDSNGCLPIYYAAFYGHMNIVLLLMLDFAFYYCYNNYYYNNNNNNY